MSALDDLDFDPVMEIAESVIKDYIQVHLNLCDTGGWSDDARKAIDQIRHLHLAEPWLPAVSIRNRLRDAGLLARGES